MSEDKVPFKHRLGLKCKNCEHFKFLGRNLFGGKAGHCEIKLAIKDLDPDEFGIGLTYNDHYHKRAGNERCDIEDNEMEIFEKFKVRKNLKEMYENDS